MPDFDKTIVPVGGNHGGSNRVYLFTNENISGYISKLDLNGKSVLSVAAGGDHAFECLLRGASFVDVYDINYAQKVVVELKTHMIKSLQYEDFMDFFFSASRFFNREIIEPIWHKFSPELNIFMSWYYALGDVAARRMFVYGRSTCMIEDFDQISYLSCRENYDKLAKILPNKINFMHSEVHKLTKKTDKKYDAILMSNIFDYTYDRLWETGSAFDHCYSKLLKPLAERNLSSKDGCICWHYIWCGVAVSRMGIVDKYEKFKKLFNKAHKDCGHRMDNMSFVSAVNDDKKDVVFTMTQRQR